MRAPCTKATARVVPNVQPDKVSRDDPGLVHNVPEHAAKYADIVTLFASTLLAERTLVQRIVPESHSGSAFSSIVRGPVDQFVNLGHILLSNSKQLVGQQPYEVVPELLATLNAFANATDTFGERTISDRATLQPVAELRESLAQLVRDALLGYVRMAAADVLEKGKQSAAGSVHMACRNVLMFLDRVMDFRVVANAQLAKADAAGTAGSGIATDAGPSAAQAAERTAAAHASPATPRSRLPYLAAYVQKAVEDITAAVEQGSRNYGSGPLASLFVLNNLHYLFGNILKSKFADLLRSDFKSSYEARIVDAIKEYQNRCAATAARPRSSPPSLTLFCLHRPLPMVAAPCRALSAG